MGREDYIGLLGHGTTSPHVVGQAVMPCFQCGLPCGNTMFPYSALPE